jgi:hypothetical protein
MFTVQSQLSKEKHLPFCIKEKKEKTDTAVLLANLG